MSGEELFVVWCKKEQDFLCNEIERLESGRLHTYSLNGPAPIDTTPLKAKLAELDGLLTKLDEPP
jgi:hypothetical protein